MITEKLQNAINEQITAEMWSSNLYLAMSFYMEKEGYNGMASWLKKQASEEKAHACEMASYIIKRGGKAKLDKIDVVPNDFGDIYPTDLFSQIDYEAIRISHDNHFNQDIFINNGNPFDDEYQNVANFKHIIFWYTFENNFGYCLPRFQVFGIVK